MKNNIDIIIYSYKGKYTKDIIQKLDEYSNCVTLIDQHPIDRKQMFDQVIKKYLHVFWDHQNSPCKYKSTQIKQSESKYLMLLSDNIFLEKNVIDSLIDFVEKNNCIVSGFGKNKISNKDLFSIKQNRENSLDYHLTNFINRDFIIGKVEYFKDIQYPEFIKYNGEEELLSLLFYKNNINIYSAPTNFGVRVGERSIEEIYCPFSIDHKYNEVVKIFKGGTYKNYNFSKEILENFSNFHNFSFSNLKELPYSNDDVLYDPNELEFLSVDGRKFVEKIRAIH
jgi:hypothetical protein